MRGSRVRPKRKVEFLEMFYGERGLMNFKYDRLLEKEIDTFFSPMYSYWREQMVANLN